MQHRDPPGDAHSGADDLSTASTSMHLSVLKSLLAWIRKSFVYLREAWSWIGVTVFIEYLAINFHVRSLRSNKINQIQGLLESVLRPSRKYTSGAEEKTLDPIQLPRTRIASKWDGYIEKFIAVLGVLRESTATDSLWTESLINQMLSVAAG
jgi:hypothetical protein